MNNQQAPSFCFICGSSLEECGIGYYQCTSIDCGEVYLPYTENDADHNQCIMHIKTPLTKKYIPEVKTEKNIEWKTSKENDTNFLIQYYESRILYWSKYPKKIGDKIIKKFNNSIKILRNSK
jgi:hypothetical protein